MDAKTIMESEEFKKCVAFHGHLCPGLCIGYRAAAEGLARVRAQRSEDEEVVAVVENDACGVDAVQWLTGCTFGKGNLIFKDYGKQVFVFYKRAGGPGVRRVRRAGHENAHAQRGRPRCMPRMRGKAEPRMNIDGHE